MSLGPDAEYSILLSNNLPIWKEISWIKITRRAVAEMVGTMILVFIHSGIAMQANIDPSSLNETGIALIQGMTITGLIYAMGHVSGAHFNPVVSLSFSLRGDFYWRLFPLYLISQFAGAFLGSLLLMGYFGKVGDLGSNIPTGDLVNAMLFEAALTFILLIVILGTANRGGVVGPQAAIGVGFTVSVLVFFGRTIGVGSMNPARSLGPALLMRGSPLNQIWVFVAGPFIGGVMATIFCRFLYSKRNYDEHIAANGEDNDNRNLYNNINNYYKHDHHEALDVGAARV